VPDDPNPLTSQALNADGTPKRPMNAFMIFARRRRPQVSAENQSMRTGEISKILSKEWVSMPAVRIRRSLRRGCGSNPFFLSPRSNSTSSKPNN